MFTVFRAQLLLIVSFILSLNRPLFKCVFFSSGLTDGITLLYYLFIKPELFTSEEDVREMHQFMKCTSM